jgi:histidinol dehydrogenase
VAFEPVSPFRCPRVPGTILQQSWTNFGEIILCDSDEEALEEAERICSEHVQLYRGSLGRQVSENPYLSAHHFQ